MLGKLIKHEFRATSRIMLPLVAAVLVLSGLSGYAAVMLDADVDYGILNMLFVIIMIGFELGIMVVCAMSLIMMIQRFYKNLLGQEGYLMFTLPVSVDALVWAKLIVSFVWFAVTGLVIMLAMLLMGTVGAAFVLDAETASRLWSGFCDLVRLVGAGNLAAYAAELILLVFLTALITCLHFYLAMAIGQSFDNRKLLWSVLAFFALNILVSVLPAVLGNVLLSLNVNLPGEFIFGSMNSVAAAKAAVHLFMGGMCAICAVYGAAFYFPTTALLKKKLNLA